MKKLLLPILLLSAICSAQKSYVSASASIDLRNATFGSKPTEFKPALDGTLSIHCVSKGFELNAGYEHFQKIGFSREFFNLGYLSERFVPIRNNDLNFDVLLYGGPSLIHRFGKEDRVSKGKYIFGNSSHLAIQAGISFRKNISDKIMIELNYEFMTRQDLIYMYPGTDKSIVGSGTVGLHYILSK